MNGVGVAYLRFSSWNQEGNNSPAFQARRCKELAESMGVLLRDEDILIDEAKSGRTFQQRERFQIVKEKIASGKYSYLFCYKFDRLGRNFIASCINIADLEASNPYLRIISATEGEDRFIRNMMLAVAEKYSEQLSERVSDGQRETTMQGYACGGWAPYGYREVKIEDSDGRTKHGKPVLRGKYVIVPEEANVVRQIFEWYAEGLSYRGITWKLNEMGISSPMGSTWDIAGIGFMLNNEVYRGRIIRGKTKKVVNRITGKRSKINKPRNEWVICENAHKAIISEELWEKVQARLNKMKRDREEQGLRATRNYHSKYLLSGLMKCGCCGNNIIYLRAKKNREGKVYRYYGCGHNWRRGSRACSNNTFVEMRKAEEAVISVFQEKIYTEENVERLTGYVNQLLESQPKNDSEKRRLERELLKLERELKNLVSSIKSGKAPQTVMDEIEELEEKRKELLMSLKEKREPNPRRLSVDGETVDKYVQDLVGTLNIRSQQAREELRKHIDNLTVLPLVTGGENYAKIEGALKPESFFAVTNHSSLTRSFGTNLNGYPPFRFEIHLKSKS